MTRLYLVAGEKSGDLHGAELMRALRAREHELEFCGRGGPAMRQLAGGRFHDWIEQAGVVGLWEVLKHYRYFRREFAATIREVAQLQPRAVVLIDYPGFNVRLARALRRKVPRAKIIYYISPQVWAWNRRRVHAMARCIDLMLCIFPFEPELYASAGLRALFVGHPMTSAFAHSEPDRPRDKRLIGIFPGSRVREVKKILPVMLSAAREISRSRPELRFEISAASEPLARIIEGMLGSSAAQFPTSIAQSRELMKRAGAAMIASGTATLEAALSRLPFVLVYRVAWLTYFAARLIVRVKHLGMPNVLAGREIVPEFIQHKARPRDIARAVIRLLEYETVRAEMLRSFDAVAGALGAGASANTTAEDAILAELESFRAPAARP
ncbi:MAG: lipid-A-disaccharide synthase [Verrucomicrobia bacterium]|nr:lipid-A-disaccharide synthase [Verrucomicrobiota bacterium]